MLMWDTCDHGGCIVENLNSSGSVIPAGTFAIIFLYLCTHHHFPTPKAALSDNNNSTGLWTASFGRESKSFTTESTPVIKWSSEGAEV